MTLRIAAAQARRLVLAQQGLAGPPPRDRSTAGLVELIERLGFLQLDSINTVARAHHMILLTRLPSYRPELLRRAVEDEARLFEHWTYRIASLLPARLYPYWRLRCAREQAATEARFKRWFGDGFTRELERLLDHIRAEGPLRARDLEIERARPAAGWWDWHAGKTALEYLWHTGQLAIARRDGFQKVYDLPERVIPAAVRAPQPSPAEMIDWACRAALDRLAIASPTELARFFGLVSIAEAKEWCARNVGAAAVPVTLESANGAPPRKLLARPDLETLLGSLPEPARRLRILNPFDPLLRDRDRLARLFAFDYRIEVFVPAPRRQYGYYVFPLLEGERLIGRLDMKADRQRATLDVSALWLEPGQKLTRARRRKLEADLDRIRRFIDADTVQLADGFFRSDG